MVIFFIDCLPKNNQFLIFINIHHHSFLNTLLDSILVLRWGRYFLKNIVFPLRKVAHSGNYCFFSQLALSFLCRPTSLKCRSDIDHIVVCGLLNYLSLSQSCFYAKSASCPVIDCYLVRTSQRECPKIWFLKAWGDSNGLEFYWMYMMEKSCWRSAAERGACLV